MNTHIYIMERRGFLQILGAFGLAPAMPISALAPAASAPIAGAAYNHHMFGHALAVIRTKGALSIAEFQSTMHFTAAQTEIMLGELASKGMISNGFSTSGILNAIRPSWFTSAPSMPAANLSKVIESKSKNVKNTLDKLTEISEDEGDVSEIEEEQTDAQT